VTAIGGARRRVAVTGVGAISALGPDAEALWRGCLAGATRAEPVPEAWHQRAELRSRAWSPLGERARPASPLLGRAEPRRLDAASQMAMAAAGEALASAGLGLELADEKRRTFRVRGWEPARSGAFLGTGSAGIVSMLAYGGHAGVATARARLRALGERLGTMGDDTHAAEALAIAAELDVPAVFNPYAVAMSMSNALSASLSIKLGLGGPTPTVAGACAAGTLAIGYAARAIAQGECDTALAGGSEHLGDAWGAIFRAFDAVGALAHGDLPPDRLSRPFDARRCGFLFAEGGCAVLVLEEFAAARRRGAPLLAEVRGFGEASDAHDIMAPDPTGAGVRRAIVACLADASLEASDVDHVNAHGTGTQGNDGVEAEAIAAVLGERPVVTATKSLLGHTLGASGALEAVVTVLALRDQVVHPLRNLEEPVAPLRFATAPTPLALRHALSQSFAFGGHDAVIALSRVE
jgi:3-oxoacyl-[acyl-carrier-protein] synthase II